MNIVVLCGGTSTEREISLRSSEGICRALQKRGHHAMLMDVFLGHENLDFDQIFTADYDIEQELAYIREEEKKLEQLKENRREFLGANVLKLCQAADAVFLGLHGANGEDGKLQALFELYGICYTGADYLSSGMAMNKSVTKQLFAAAGVPMAKGITVLKNEERKPLEACGLNYPCVVKPGCGGSSVGVYYAKDDNEYEEALNQAFVFEDELVVEECIQGREFSVGILAEEALPVIEIIPNQGTYDYENKYTPGAVLEICPAEVTEELREKIQNAALMAAKALGIDTYCRVDVLTDKEENCYCLEANTLPGMTATSLLPQEAAAVGMDYPALCEKLIQISMEQKRTWKTAGKK